MKTKPINTFFILFILGFLFGCDHGINPGNVEEKLQGIRGTIYYQHWPQQSALFDLRLVVFNNYPPTNIFNEVSQGQAAVYPPLGSPDNLPFNVDSTEYTMTLNPGIYEYVVIAQQYGPDILKDWQAVGQYDTTLQDTIPTSIEIFSDSVITGINIYVDFDSLPGQPF